MLILPGDLSSLLTAQFHCSPCPEAFPFPPAAQHVISEAKGPCFRVLRDGGCSLPILRNITKQICCCSRVGKAWGRGCQLCPPYGSGEGPLLVKLWIWHQLRCLVHKSFRGVASVGHAHPLGSMTPPSTHSILAHTPCWGSPPLKSFSLLLPRGFSGDLPGRPRVPLLCL